MYDGAIQVHGLHDAVSIRRNRWGIPHIEAKSDHDAWFGLGFCQGQDRCFQIQGLMRIGRGCLSELLGPPGVKIDRISRRVGFHRSARKQFDAMDAESRDTLRAFTSGVNAGVESGLRKKPHEFALLLANPIVMEPQDVLGTLAVMGFLLPSNWDAELARLYVVRKDGIEATRAIDPTQAKDLLLADIEALLAATGKSGGSNNWALHAKTASGRPLSQMIPILVLSYHRNGTFLTSKLRSGRLPERVLSAHRELFQAIMGMLLGE